MLKTGSYCASEVNRALDQPSTEAERIHGRLSRVPFLVPDNPPAFVAGRFYQFVRNALNYVSRHYLLYPLSIYKMPIYTVKSTVILIILFLLFNNSCTNIKTVVVSRPNSYSTPPSSQTDRLIPQNDKLQRDYSPDRSNLQRIYLEDLQKGFDHKYESKYEEKDFTELKFFLRALIELDTRFNEQTDFPVLIQNALFGVVSYAKFRLKQEISLTREELHVDHNKVSYRWINERSVGNDLNNIENFETSLQALKSCDPDMEIKDLVAAGIYAMYKMVRDPYTSSYPAFPEVDLSLNLKDKVLMLDKIGMTIGYEDGQLKVVNLQYGFTAYEAGIKTGDQIIKINVLPIESLSLQQIEKLFDGKINHLTVTRNISEGQRQASFIIPNQLMYNYFNPNPTTRYCLLEKWDWVYPYWKI